MNLNQLVYRVLAFVFTLAPAAVFATGPTGPQAGFGFFGNTVKAFIGFVQDYLVPGLFALAFIVFLWGIYMYFIQGGANAEKRETASKLVMWGLIGFVVMLSVWGLVSVLADAFNLNNVAAPTLPSVPGA